MLVRFRTVVLAALALAGAGALLIRAAAAWCLARRTPPCVERAAAWTPGDAQAQRLLALALEDTDPAASAAALERALRLNPRDWQAWLESGLRDASEERLLRAAELNRRYLPRWTLANFYFQRGDAERFWPWARSALEITYLDPKPLYRLCWRMAPDGGVVAHRVVPATALGRAHFLVFLLADGHLGAVPEAAAALLDAGTREYAPLVLTAAGRLLEQGRTGEAVRVWNGAAHKRWIPYHELSPEQGSLVVDPGFQSGDFSGLAFQWHLARAGKGISAAHQPGALRLTFDGTQPEAADILTQRVILPRSTKCRLVVESAFAGDTPPVGIEVQLRMNGTAVTAPAEFTTPAAGVDLAILALNHRRRPGTSRWSGALTLRRIDIEVVVR